MPIVRINPDGTVRIARKSGKNPIDVKPEELSQYSPTLLGEYNVYREQKNILEGKDPKIEQQAAKAEQEKKEAKDKVSASSQSVIDVINAGKSGQLKGDQYKDALRNAASRMAADIGFAQGGKALTGPELAVLAGSMPNIDEEMQSFFSKLIGRNKAQTGNLKDDEETLRRKAQLAISGITPESLKTLSDSEKNQPDGNILQNAGSDVKEILNSILGLPHNIGVQMQDQTKRGLNPLQAILETGGNIATGVASEYNELAGRPLEGGDIVGIILQRAQQKPVTTAIDVLPVLGVGRAALATKGGRVAETAKFARKTQVAQKANLLQDILNTPQQVGQNMRKNVRQIDVGPMVGGPQKEAVINQTLDDLKFTGGPSEQYAKLQPVMTKLEDTIQAQLQASPKSIKLDDIKNDFMTNLKDEMRTTDLTDKIARKEVNGYLADIYGEGMKETMNTPELFKVKQSLNKDYQRVQKKINAGTPLTSREQVISIARKTVDDIIATAHPNVKKQTLQQSNLFDAADSLYKRRGENPYAYLFGTRVPIPGAELFRGGQDLLGRILSGTYK